jgi:hypothetical protein
MEFFSITSRYVIDFQDLLKEVNDGFFILFTDLLCKWRLDTLSHFQNGLFSAIQLLSELSKFVSLECKNCLFTLSFLLFFCLVLFEVSCKGFICTECQNNKDAEEKDR